MALLVDEPLWPAHGTTWAHLVSDTSLAELHEFARAQDLPRRSFDLDHYDVPAATVPRLVAAGAVPVDRRTLLRSLRASGLRVPQGRRAAEQIARRDSALLGRWAALGRSLVGEPPQQWAELGEQVLRRWREPHRHYHDVRHLDGILLDLDTLADLGARVSPVVELAAWWHDAVHTGRTPADEEASADLARRALTARALGAALPDGVAEETARLILVTAHHRPSDSPAAVLSDADLAILAAPAERYADYAADVRREYPRVGDADFREGRRRVLEGLLDRRRIYTTPQARDRWEDQARRNLAQEIARLAP